MKNVGDKVVVTFKDDNYNRPAKLVKVTHAPLPEFGLYNNIWEVEFQDGKEPLTARYNEYWLQPPEGHPRMDFTNDLPNIPRV
jgi:hypothetical protein